MIIAALIRSMKFLSLKVALYLYKSTIQPCMEYCCHAWASKWICRTAGPSLATSLEPSANHQNIASLIFSIGITQRRSTHYSDRLHDFS